jgi:hypothetical protein
MEKRDSFGVLMRPEYKETLRALAQANAETMAATVRVLIREEAMRRGLWPMPEAKQEAKQHA